MRPQNSSTAANAAASNGIGSGRSSGGGSRLAEGSMLPPGPSLVHLPEPMVWHFLRIARNVICEKFVPILWKLAARRRRERALQRRPLAQDRMAAERACEAALLASSEFVHSAGTAPELAYLLSRRGRLCSFQPGEVIACEGEPCAAGAVVVLSGRVDLFQTVHRKKDSTRYVGLRTTNSRHHDDDQRRANTSPHAIASDCGMDYSTDVSFVDVRGVHHPQHLRFSAIKRKGLTSAQWVQSMDAPFVAGDLGVMNNEPRLHFMVAAAPLNSNNIAAAALAVDVMIIPQTSFFAVFQALPNLAASLRLLSVAHTVRTANLPIAFPLTTNRLRQSPLLKRFSEEELELLLVCARPRVYAKGTVVLERGRSCQHIVVVRRGVVEEVKERGGARSSVALWEGATFAEREAYFKERSDASYVASTNVDAYLVPMEEVTRMCARSETLRARVAEAAKLLRVSDAHEDVLQLAKSSMYPQRDGSALGKSIVGLQGAGGGALDGVGAAPAVHRYVELMRAIPLWRLLEFPSDLLEALQPLWSSHLFSRGEYLCRRSEVCSQMMIVLRGRAHIVGDGAPSDSGGGVLTVGECFGYTCLVEHRWQYSAVATEVTEVISLSREDLYDALSAWDAGHRSPSAEHPAFVAQTPTDSDRASSPMGSGGTPVKSKFLQRLTHATMQLIQPLLRQPTSTSINAALDAASRRAPHPNTLDELTIANMHPISREEHVPAYPVFVPVRLRPPPTKRTAAAARAQASHRNDARAQLLEELEVHATKLQNRRASSVLVAEGNGPGQTLRRRSTLVDLSHQDARGTPISSAKGGTWSPRMPSSPSLGRGVDAKAAATVVPPSRGLVPDVLPQDPAGNLMPGVRSDEHVIHVNFLPRPVEGGDASCAHHPPGHTPQRDPSSLSAVFDAADALSNGTNGNASTSTYGTDQLLMDDPHNPLGSKPFTSAATIQRTPSEVMAEQVERVASPLRGSDKLHDIMRPTKPRTQSVQDEEARQEVVLSDTGTVGGDDGAPAAAANSKGVNGTDAPPPAARSRLIRQVHLKPVTPRARKTLTYSASERYGSLMEAMMLAASSSPRSRTSTPQHAVDAPETTTVEGSPRAPYRPYMWHSTSVAAPLLASRPQSATLRSRVSEAHRSALSRPTTPADSPRCTAVQNRRVFGSELRKGP